MWDLIVSVPDHCLSFHFSSIATNCAIELLLQDGQRKFADYFLVRLIAIELLCSRRTTRPKSTNAAWRGA